MAVRNFYIEAEIDGRETLLKGGPRGKDGGIDVTFYIRDRGSILKALRVSGWYHPATGTLELSVREEAPTFKDFYGDRSLMVPRG